MAIILMTLLLLKPVCSVIALVSPATGLLLQTALSASIVTAEAASQHAPPSTTLTPLPLLKRVEPAAHTAMNAGGILGMTAMPALQVNSALLPTSVEIPATMANTPLGTAA